MSYLFEKVAYVRGLADGLEIDQTTKEGKLLTQIIDVLDDFASAFDELDTDLGELEDYVEAMDDDLADLEEELLGIEYDAFDCPKCGELVLVDQDIDEGECCFELTCPDCGETFDVVDDTCECDCDCEPAKAEVKE